MDAQRKIELTRDIKHVFTELGVWIRKYEPEFVLELITPPVKDVNLKKLAEIVHQIYLRDRSASHMFKDIYTLNPREGYEEKIFDLDLLYQEMVAAAATQIESHKNVFRTEQAEHFLHVKLNSTPIKYSRKLYLNVKPNYIAFVIHKLMTKIINTNLKVEFKFPLFDIENWFILSDKLIIYFGDQKHVIADLRRFVDEIKACLLPHAQLFTHRITHGAGFANPPNHKQKEYLSQHMPGWKTYGHFMCLAVAEYYYRAVIKEKKMPNDLLKVTGYAIKRISQKFQ